MERICKRCGQSYRGLVCHACHPRRNTRAGASAPEFAVQAQVGDATIVITPTDDGQALEVAPITEHLVTLAPFHDGAAGLFLVPVPVADGETAAVTMRADSDCARNQ